MKNKKRKPVALLESENGPGEEGDAGYGKPPGHSRFKPGQSGNPKGRRKGLKNRKKIVEEIANKMQQVEEGGQRKRRSTLDLILLSIRNRAMKGSVKAFRAYHKLLEKYGPHETLGGVTYLFSPEMLSLEEWLEKVEPLKNKYSEKEKED